MTFPSPRSSARVKLTSWSEAVKPDLSVLLAAVLAALLAALGLLVTWTLFDPQQARMERFGASTVAALAELSMEPLLKQDRLHLGVIGNRLVELDEITAVATYTVDNQLMTLSGTLTGPQFAESISIDDNIVGHVRITLDPAAFDGGFSAPQNRSQALWISLLIVLGAGLGASMLSNVWREWRSGRLVFERPSLPTALHRGRRGVPAPAADSDDEDAGVTPEETAPPADIRHYLLGVNLYNQLSLQGAEREFELSLCTELAEAVALEYQGQVVSLPGLGALVDFDHTDEEDRAFDVVCAGFALARLLRDESPFGNYRLGLHVVSQVGDEPLPLDHPAVGDVSLLSALARDSTLAISESLFTAIGASDRLMTRPMANVLLEELVTSGTDCQIVTDLATPDKHRMLQLVDSLKTQRDSMASESTF